MYTYGELLDDVNYLSRFGLETGAIGASRFGRLIPYARVGTGKDKIIVTAAIHAREHVSALFAVKQLYKTVSEDPECSIYFVPMVNPDGNVLVEKGAEAFKGETEYLINLNGGNSDFSLWKANADGVDLNTNFDAKWGTGERNVKTAGSENYIGECPFSEPETRALAEFTRKIKPCLTISYHAKGREIYYEFGQSEKELARDGKIARYAAQLTGYSLIEGTRGSAGGYKDWCISELKLPSLTVELADDALKHPLPDSSINDDFKREPLLPVKLYRFIKSQNFI